MFSDAPLEAMLLRQFFKSTNAAGTTMMVCGDSITQDTLGYFFAPQSKLTGTVTSAAGICNYAASYSMGRVIYAGGCSQGGWKIADVLSNFDTYVGAYQPRIVCLEIGWNDLNTASNDGTALRAGLIVLINKILTWGGVPLVWTITPTDTAGQMQQLIKHNEWVRSLPRKNSRIFVFDYAALVTDPSDTGGAHYGTPHSITGASSGPHPSFEWNRALGYELWLALQPIVSAGPESQNLSQYFVQPDNQQYTSQCMANPGLTGTGGTVTLGSGTLPNNCLEMVNQSSTGSTTFTAGVASTDFAWTSGNNPTGANVLPNWVQVSIDTSKTLAYNNGSFMSTGSTGIGVYFLASQNTIVHAGEVYSASVEILPVTITAAHKCIGFGVWLATFNLGTSTCEAMSPWIVAAYGYAADPLSVNAASKGMLIRVPDMIMPANSACQLALTVGAFFQGSGTGSMVFKIRRPTINLLQTTP